MSRLSKVTAYGQTDTTTYTTDNNYHATLASVSGCRLDNLQNPKDFYVENKFRYNSSII